MWQLSVLVRRLKPNIARASGREDKSREWLESVRRFPKRTKIKNDKEAHHSTSSDKKRLLSTISDHKDAVRVLYGWAHSNVENGVTAFTFRDFAIMPPVFSFVHPIHPNLVIVRQIFPNLRFSLLVPSSNGGELGTNLDHSEHAYC